MKAINLGPNLDSRDTLHYLGYDNDRGGIVSVVRALASARCFRCVLGVNPGFHQLRNPPLPTMELPPLAGESLDLRTFWRARKVAGVVSSWLRAEPGRIFHGHSRAGLAVALWLGQHGENRAVASVHCYGRQRWFYRWASSRLGARLFWVSPAMKRHYYVDDGSWAQCIPGCLPAGFSVRAKPDRPHNGFVRLGGIGALVSWKGWHLVLEALGRMPSAMQRRFRFKHIGSSDDSPESVHYAAAVRARATALGLDRIVEWRGEQPSSTEFLEEIDCLVVPSRSEPFSMATLEALAMGVPVLATDSGGPRDILNLPRNGWLFRSGDVNDLARGLAMLAEGDALSRVRVDPQDLVRFSATVVARQWVQIYADLSGAK